MLFFARVLAPVFFEAALVGDVLAALDRFFGAEVTSVFWDETGASALEVEPLV